MTGKTIAEAIEGKNILQKEIAHLVEKYQDEYGIYIDKIEIDTVEYFGVKPYRLINLIIKL